MDDPLDDYEDVYHKGLHGWYKKGITGDVILCLHGNGGNISKWQTFFSKFGQMGHSLMMFDYTGYGNSEGEPTEKIVLQNGIDMYHYLLGRGYTRDHIIPVGFSLGGAVASYLVSKENLPQVILINSLMSIRQTLKNGIFDSVEYFRYVKYFSFLCPEFNTIKYLKNYKGKIILLHSTEDEVIKYDNTLPLQPMCFAVIPITGGHCSANVPWTLLRSWLNRSNNPWLEHVRHYRISHPNLTYKQVLTEARLTYKKVH